MNARSRLTDYIAWWRAEPAKFIEAALVNPIEGGSFVLLPAERAFLARAFLCDTDGRLKYPEQIYSAPKKTGKTTFAALHLLTTIVLFGGKHAEGYVIANDLEQATGRVFDMVRKIIEASPILRDECTISASKIVFNPTGATIIPLASDYASAAGGHPTISSFDELLAYTPERSRRLWDEMVPVPTRRVSVRLTTTYAGFEGESDLLHELFKRGMAQPEVAPGLRAGDGLLCFWTHNTIAPWQTDRWIAEMQRALRPNQFLRMIRNEWVSSENSFISMDDFDACVDPRLGALLSDRNTQIWVGVDASVKHDHSAIVAVSMDRSAGEAKPRPRLAYHRVFKPSPEQPLDFEATIEASLIDLSRRFAIQRIWYDPYQMARSAQTLTREGLPLEEFPQTLGNLTEASQNLYELISSRSLIMYPDEGIRRAAAQAIAIETPRGFRIAKDKSAHKIDVIVALAQAALAAVRDEQRGWDPTNLSWVEGPTDAAPPERTYAAQRLSAYIMAHTGWV